jgi:uncharacterized protein (TIRG00374 family)
MAAPEPKQINQSNKFRRILSVATLIAMLALIYFLRDQIIETFTNLGNVNFYFLFLIIVWQILNYHTYAKLYQSLFEILGTKIGYKSMYKVAVELNFVNHVFPSAGVSGFSYFGLRMRQLGATAAQSALVQTMRFVTVFISFQVLLFGGLLMLAIDNQASNLAILVASTMGTLLFVGTWLVIYIVGDRKRIDSFFTALTKSLNYLIRLVRPRHPETISIVAARKQFLEFHENYNILRKNYKKLKMPLFYSFFASLTEILTIYAVYMAFDEWVNLGAVILAYAIANFAGLISVLPGGIGVYEGLMTAVLATVGVPPSKSLPVTVMYRVLSMLVQLPPGYYLYQKALQKNDKPLV